MPTKPHHSGSQRTVKIFTSPACGFCHMLQEYLDDHEIDYEHVDVSSNHQALEEMLELSGQSGVPVTMIWGGTSGNNDEPVVIVGFDKMQLDKILGIKD